MRIDIGANASAEEADEALEDGAQTVNNIVHSFRLQSTSFDKKAYLGHLKSTFSTLSPNTNAAPPPRRSPIHHSHHHHRHPTNHPTQRT